jgi:hypothetical protein
VDKSVSLQRAELVMDRIRPLVAAAVASGEMTEAAAEVLLDDLADVAQVYVWITPWLKVQRAARLAREEAS